jgi:hypothetical protein
MAMSNMRPIISLRYIEGANKKNRWNFTVAVVSPVMNKSFRTSTADGAVVEFGLVRHALLAKLAEGLLRHEDICDAHPELLRAAKNIGRSTGETCPVCHDEQLVEVTYVFGARLPAGGTCPTSRAELLKLERREEPVQCYAVEVCVGCSFHHLVRKWIAGGRRARRALPQQKKVGQ